MELRIDKLIIDNMGLVYNVINKNFKGYCDVKSSNRDELIGEGMVALVKAAKRYNPDLGYKFSSYAHRCIWGELMTVVTKNKEIVHNISLYSLDSTIDVEGEDSSSLLDIFCSEEEHYKDIETKELLEKIKKHKKIKKLKGSDFIIDSLIEGKTYSEIARELGSSHQVIGKRVERIRELAKIIL